MENNFILDLIACLQKGESRKQLNSDIKNIEKTLNMLRLTGTFAKGETKKELNAYIKQLSNQLSTIKLKAKIDSKNLKSEVDKALNSISFKDIDALNIDENKTKLKVKKIIADTKTFVEKNPVSLGINIESKKNKLGNDLTAYLNRNTKINESSILLKEADKVRDLISAINDKKSLREATDAFQLYKSEVSATGYATKSTADRIKSMFGHITKLGSLFSVASLAANNFTKSLGTLKEIDDILTEISKTSDLTAQQLEKLGNISFKSASKYGKTASDYLTGIQEMSRSGFYGEKGTAMAEQSLLAQAAGDMSADLANNYILATNAAYKLNGEAEKINAVLDGQNSITNRNSVAMSDMAAAMSKAGTVASSYRVSVEDLSAMIGTIESVTKAEGGEVGNGIKAILINLQNITSSKIKDTLDAANASMTEFVNDTEKLRDPISILRDLADTFNKLDEDDALRAEILTNIGGKHQATKLAALLQNMELFDKMLVDYSEGAGSAMEEAMKSANNWSGKLNQLQNSWDSLVNSIINKDTVLSGLTFGDKLIRGAESLVNTVGEIPVLLTTINAAMTAMQKDYGITKVWDKENRKIDVEGNIFGINISKIKDLKKHYGEAGEAIAKWNNKLKGGKVDIDAFNDSVVQNSASLKEYLSTCSKDAPASLNGYKNYLQSTGQATEDLRLQTILLNTALTFLGSIAVQAIITGFANAFDKFNETVVESKEKVDDINAKISDLKSQIEELNNLEYKSDFDKQKISQLEKELALQERILEVEQKRLYQNQIGTKLSDYFDEDSLITKQQSEYDRYNKEGYKYLSVRFEADKTSLEEVEAELTSLQDKLNNGLSGHDKFVVESNIAKLTEKRNDILKEQQSIEEQLTINMGEYLKNFQTAQEAIDSGLLTGSDLEKAQSMADYWNEMYQSSSDMVTSIQKMNGTYDNTNDLLEEMYSNISRDDLVSLSDDDKRIALSFDPNNTIGFEELKRQIEETKGNIEGLNATEVKSFDQAWADSFTSENDSVKELGNSLLELAEQGRLTINTFNTADSTGYFKNLGISADEAVLKINKLVDESKQLSSMSSQISSMAEALSTKQENGFVEADTLSGFDVEVRGLDSWDRFQEVLGSTTSSYEECQEAANALATEWVNSSDFLAQLTEQNKEYYATQLEAMGVENYEEVISYAQALNEAKEALAQSSLMLGNATYDEIEALIAEGQYSGLTADLILQLYNAKIAEQAATIDTSADCANLIALAGDTDRTYQSIQLLIQLMDIYSGLESGAYNGNRLLREEALAEVDRIKGELEAIANGEGKELEIKPQLKLDENKAKKSAGSAGKEAGDAYVDAFEEEYSNLKDMLDRGEISEAQYLNALRSLYTKYFRDRKEYLDEFKKYESEYLSGMLDLHNKALSGISTLLNRRISTANDAKDAALDALNDEKDAALDRLDAEKQAQIDLLEAKKKAFEEEIKAIDKQIKAKGKVIDGINDEIDAMRDANNERQRQLDLQKAQYELERMQNQRTILQYSEEKGMHYVADTKNIRDKKQDVEDAKLEIDIANKEKQISLIEKEIDLLEDKKDAINEQIDLLDEEIDRINDYYDNMIKDTEKYYDNLIKQQEDYWNTMIKGMEQQKSRWEELAEVEEVAKAFSYIQQVFGELGYSVEDVLNGSDAAFEDFKSRYISVINDMNSNSDFTDGLVYATGVAKENLGSFLDKTKETGTGIDELSAKGSELNTVAEGMSGLATSASGATAKISETVTGINNVNTSLSETASKTNDVTANVSDFTAKLSEVTTIVTEEQSAFDDLKLKIEEVISAINDKITAIQEEQNAVNTATNDEITNFLMLKEKILEVKESVDSMNTTVATMDTTAVNELTTAFQLLYDQILLVSTALGAGMEGAVGGIASAIQALNEISLEDGIIAQFTNLKTSIDEVTSAISGGGTGESTSNDKSSDGGSGSKSGAGESGGKGSKGEGGGSNSLSGAITEMGETAKQVIGEPGAEGDGTVIGEFGSMKTAVNDVTEAIGSGDSEGGTGESSGSGQSEGSGNLIDSIINLGETSEETLGESGGDGVIGRFEEFKDVIGEAKDHVIGISEGLDDIDGKEVECTIKVNIETSGAFPAFDTGTALNTMDLNSAEYNAQYSGKAHAEGTALASGNWTVQSNEQSALVGEEGFEIIVRNGRFFTVGDNGAEMTNVKKGDIVFNHEQSAQLLKHGHISGRGKAYADGTVGGGKILTSDGTVLMPVQPDDKILEYSRKFDAYLEKIGNNVDIITNSGLFKHENQMDELVKHVTNNVNNVTNNKNVQPIVHQNINISCPNVTNNSGVEYLQKQFGNLSQRAMQEAYKQ